MAIILRDKVYFIGDNRAITDCTQAEAETWLLIIKLLEENSSKIEYNICNELENAWIQVNVINSNLYFQINIGVNYDNQIYMGVCYYIAEEDESSDTDYYEFEEFEKEFNQYVNTGRLDWF